MSWPEFEPDQFIAASQSMVRFGQKVFSAYQYLYCCRKVINFPADIQPPPSAAPQATTATSSAAVHQNDSTPNTSMLAKAIYSYRTGQDDDDGIDIPEVEDQNQNYETE